MPIKDHYRSAIRQIGESHDIPSPTTRPVESINQADDLTSVLSYTEWYVGSANPYRGRSLSIQLLLPCSG